MRGRIRPELAARRAARGEDVLRKEHERRAQHEQDLWLRACARAAVASFRLAEFCDHDAPIVLRVPKPGGGSTRVMCTRCDAVADVRTYHDLPYEFHEALADVLEQQIAERDAVRAARRAEVEARRGQMQLISRIASTARAERLEALAPDTLAGATAIDFTPYDGPDGDGWTGPEDA